MVNRLLAFMGACCLILIVIALVPMVPAHAQGSNCINGSCDTPEDNKQVCTNPGHHCGTGSECRCRTAIICACRET